MRHLRVIEKVCERVGIPILYGAGKDSDFAWTGCAISLQKNIVITEPIKRPASTFGVVFRHVDGTQKRDLQILLHDVAHYQLSAPHRRGRVDFGLNADSMTNEERLASVLGVAWENHYCGWRAARKTLDNQYWITGRSWHDRLEATVIVFAHIFWLQKHGYLTERGEPTTKLKQKGEKSLAHFWELKDYD